LLPWRQALAKLEAAKSRSAAAASVKPAAAKAAAEPEAKTSPAREARRPSVLGNSRRSVTVRVPATSANLGSGFDCVGMALDVWNELTLERSETYEMIVEGEGAGLLPLDEEGNLVCLGVKTAFEHAGLEVPLLKYTCVNKIPFGRGLGSSSGAIVSGLVAGLALCGKELSVYGGTAASHEHLYGGGDMVEPEELLQLAGNIEGHPDNVCPCIYGGVQLAIGIDRPGSSPHWRSSRVDIPYDIQLVAFVPDAVGETSVLRGVLPDTYSKEDCVFNVGRVAFLVNSLQNGRLWDLRYGCEDAMHQGYRGKAVYSHLDPIIKAAQDAGCHGAYLSGAGPTVLAVTSGLSGDPWAQRSEERRELRIAEAMIKAAEDAGWPGRCFVTKPCSSGAYITKADPPFSDGILKFLGGSSADQEL